MNFHSAVRRISCESFHLFVLSIRQRINFSPFRHSFSFAMVNCALGRRVHLHRSLWPLPRTGLIACIFQITFLCVFWATKRRKRAENYPGPKEKARRSANACCGSARTALVAGRAARARARQTTKKYKIINSVFLLFLFMIAVRRRQKCSAERAKDEKGAREGKRDGENEASEEKEDFIHAYFEHTCII